MDVQDDLEPLEFFGESFHPLGSNKLVDRDLSNSFADNFDDSDINWRLKTLNDLGAQLDSKTTSITHKTERFSNMKVLVQYTPPSGLPTKLVENRLIPHGSKHFLRRSAKPLHLQGSKKSTLRVTDESYDSYV